MGCGCGSKKRDPMPFGAVRISTPKPNQYGMFTLANGDCSTPYTGMYRSASVYVVDIGGDYERLFTRADATAAVAYAKETKTRITHVSAHQLCHDTMIELFGA